MQKKQKRYMIKIPEELKRELQEIIDTVYPYRVPTYTAILLFPRCHSCGAYIVKLDKDKYTCIRCKKNYKIVETE